MMGEKYIFKWANDSINEVFKPLWLNDTTYHCQITSMLKFRGMKL